MLWYSLRTIFIEVEAIVNSRPITTKRISNSQSLLPLLPTNVLKMKSKVIMLPPGTFLAAKINGRKRWKRSGIMNFGRGHEMSFCKRFRNGKLDVV